MLFFFITLNWSSNEYHTFIASFLLISNISHACNCEENCTIQLRLSKKNDSPFCFISTQQINLVLCNTEGMNTSTHSELVYVGLTKRKELCGYSGKEYLFAKVKECWYLSANLLKYEVLLAERKNVLHGSSLVSCVLDL